MRLLQEFIDPSKQSMRSSNVDDSNHTPSILDEFEAQEVLNFLTNSNRVAGNVWGDIYRNRFLDSIRNAPVQLTPQDCDQIQDLDDIVSRFNGPVNVDKLRKSPLWNGFIPPDKSKLAPSLRAHQGNRDSNLSRENASLLQSLDQQSYMGLMDINRHGSKKALDSSNSSKESQRNLSSSYLLNSMLRGSELNNSKAPPQQEHADRSPSERKNSQQVSNQKDKKERHIGKLIFLSKVSEDHNEDDDSAFI